MRLSRQLEEAIAFGRTSYYVRPPNAGSAKFKVQDPYSMHVAHDMPLSPTFITKGRKGVEAKGPRLFLSAPSGKWRVEVMLKGVGKRKHTIESKKEAYKLARKLLGKLRAYGDDFVVNDGKRSWRVEAGDTMAFSRARQGVEAFFKRGGP
jgi:hypothetical protein